MNKEDIKILFLDMDGVVNSNQEENKWFDEKIKSGMSIEETEEMFLKEFCNYTELIFPKHANLVSKIVKETGCKIVWSSSWRKLIKYRRISDAIDMFNRRGLPGNSLIAYTPDMNLYAYNPRGYEIKAFLDAYKRGEYEASFIYGKIIKAVSLDDVYEAEVGVNGESKLFRTTMMHGLTDEIAESVIKYLKE